jgi:hypothetical protein
MHSIQSQHVTAMVRPTTGSALRALALGGAAVGVLDAADGVAYFGLTAGKDPIQVLQYIASGALGPSAASHGLAAAGFGALIHFGLAYAFTAAFILAWTRVQPLRRAWAAVGLAWGAAVWAFMNLLVLPLTRVQHSPITLGAAIHGIVGHALFVGLAAAIVARRFVGAGSHVSSSDVRVAA